MVTSSFGLFTTICTLVILDETHPVAKNAPGGWPGHVGHLLVRLLTCPAFSKRAVGADGAQGELSNSSDSGSASLVVFVGLSELTQWPKAA